jgi:glucose-6-phosphate isomerase
MASRTPLTGLAAHAELQGMARTLRGASIEQLFADDPGRAGEFTLEAAGLQLDYSKHLLDREAQAALVALADEAGLGERIPALLDGADINNTENRPALHSLLRASSGGELADKFEEVVAARARMRDYAERLNRGELQGYSGETITDVVNIGIGGSDLGPRLVTEALRPYHGSVNCHYVANVDPADLQDTLQALDPRSTLFIVCSKSFRTEETLTNSLAARDWMLEAGATEGLGGGALLGVVGGGAELRHRGGLGTLRAVPRRGRGHGQALP